MVVGTEEIPAGKSIPVHKHSHADEFIVLQEGTASVTLGARRQTVNAGAMIFIPENEWVGLDNVGQGTMKILFVFSAVGFEEYLRATSVPEGTEVTPLTLDEVREISVEGPGTHCLQRSSNTEAVAWKCGSNLALHPTAAAATSGRG